MKKLIMFLMILFAHAVGAQQTVVWTDGTYLFSLNGGTPSYISSFGVATNGFSMIARSGGSWKAIASSSNGNNLVAAKYPNNTLYTSTDGGATWVSKLTNAWFCVASSYNGTNLVAGAVTDFTGTGYIYTSTNAGSTWIARATDAPRNWVGITSSANGTNLVATSQSGVYASTNAGITWVITTNRTACSGVASSADGIKLVMAEMAGSAGRLYTSTDAGTNWTARGTPTNYYSVASSADGVKLFAGVLSGQIYTSTDSGVTWSPTLNTGSWFAVSCSADGTKVVASDAQYGQYKIYTSTNSGVNWTTGDSIGLRGLASSFDGSKVAGFDSTYSYAGGFYSISGGGGGGDVYLANNNVMTGTTNTFTGTIVVTNDGRSVWGINLDINSIQPTSEGSTIRGYNEGYQFIGNAGASFGASIIGHNHSTGTQLVFGVAEGSIQSGYNGGLMVMNFARGAMQYGLNNGIVSNLASHGSLQLFNLTAGQSSIMNQAPASIGLGAVNVTNKQSIVAGDGQVSHGAGSITAVSVVWASSLVLTNLPTVTNELPVGAVYRAGSNLFIMTP